MGQKAGGFVLPGELQAICDQRRRALDRPHWAGVQRDLERLLVPEEIECDCGSPVVRFGGTEDLDANGRALLRGLITRLIPWRKGPFSVCGEAIDAEWRSDWKWERIAPALPPLAGRRVLDIGCNNGYYLFRASAHGAGPHDPPETLLGIDPSEAFSFAFSLFQKFYRHERLRYELLGIEHVRWLPRAFDVILCLGVLYHHRDPLTLLQDVRASLDEGGMAIVESQTIPGETSTALFPEGRYAKAHNVYFLPTAACLVSWMKRAGFRNVEVVSETPVTPDEQRQTSLMPYESLSDYLSRDDPRQTVEGHPAPRRTAVRGLR